VSKEPQYLGDAIYADNDGWMIRLVVDKGSPAERTVWLEAPVLAALVRYAQEEMKW
jgi:hypothetical protein